MADWRLAPACNRNRGLFPELWVELLYSKAWISLLDITMTRPAVCSGRSRKGSIALQRLCEHSSPCRPIAYAIRNQPFGWFSVFLQLPRKGGANGHSMTNGNSPSTHVLGGCRGFAKGDQAHDDGVMAVVLGPFVEQQKKLHAALASAAASVPETAGITASGCVCEPQTALCRQTF